MTPVPGIHYDGQTADGQSVQVAFEGPDLLCMVSESGTLRFPLGSVTGEPPLGSAHRFLLLPDRSMCEYAADAAGADWLASLVPGTRSAVEPIERRPFLTVAATALVIAAVLSLVTGDAPPGSMLLAAGPGFLLQTAYSRNLEREADRAAVELLNRRGIPPSRLGGLLARLEARQKNGDGTPNLLSTHPPTSDRIRQTSSTSAGNSVTRASR